MFSSFDFSISSNFIDKLKSITVEELSNDPLIRSKLNKIKLQATMPFCAEQVISILVEILSLKHDYKINQLSKILKFDDPANIAIFVNAILPLLAREHDDELRNKLEKAINDFSLRGGSEKIFFEEIKTLHNKYISCIDIDFVMQTAAHTQKLKETADKNAILVVGKTGAGKSFVINHICCEEMFSRSSKIFGHKLTIHHDKQPAYLKHIKIGESVKSETSKMGVVDVSKSTSQWMSKFRNHRYVICDTPGAGDNRRLGPELKLANSLETIVPMYKANSVRFLIIISSKATSARGEEFRETIKFVAKMFGSTTDLNSAANSMVFAINGEDGDKYVEEFKRQLEEFYGSRYSLQLDEIDIELIQILRMKFKSNEVYLIQPGKDRTIKPEELMSKLHACEPINPKILTPFAESNIKELLEHESSLLTQSIDRIFASLEDDISSEVMQIQVQRLGQKLAKLSFMDAYYSINQSNLLPYFDKLARLMDRFQELILSTCCPKNGAINDKHIKMATEALERLRELDQMVSMMINGLFYENRDRVASLIAAFDRTAVPPSDFKKMPDRDWFEWVAHHRPQSASKKIEEEIKKYRITLSNRLNGLINIQLNQIHVEKVKSLVMLQDAGPQQVPYARTTSLDRQHYMFHQHVETNLSKVLPRDSDLQLRNYFIEITEKLKKEINIYVPNDSNPELALSDVVRNLQLQDIYLKDLFISDNSHQRSLSVQSDQSHLAQPSAPLPDNSNEDQEMDVHSSQDILGAYYTFITRKLFAYAHAVIPSNDFAAAVNVIDTIYKVVNLFGFAPPEGLIELEGSFNEFFTLFVRNTKQLIIKDNQPLNADDIQSLLLNLSIIANVRKLKTFSKYTGSESGLYQSTLQLELDSLASELSDRFTLTISEIRRVCREYTEENFVALDTQLKQLWYVLSLPSDNHAQLASQYAEVAKSVSEYCMKISGELIGQLQIDTPINQSLYKKITAYLGQLKSLTMVAVLNLGQAEINLKDALNQRALFLINRIDMVDLSLAFGDNVTINADLIQELEKLGKEFSEYLPQSTLIEIQKALQAYNKRVSTTLSNITSHIESLKIDKNVEMPVQFFIQSHHYLNSCEKMQMFMSEVSANREKLKKVTQQYAAVKKLSMDEMLESLNPKATITHLTPTMITTNITQFEQLQKNVPELYAACDNPIRVWTGQLYDLALQYQAELTEALQKATFGNTSNHQELLQRVSQFQVFDVYIKQSIPDSEKPLTFKKLSKRFENAFQVANFSKLKNVMLAIFNGQFEIAQQLATEDKELALGTDMRLVLIDQIGTYISASISTIERDIAQLKLNPTASPSYMRELMQSYDRIKSAQRLVDAGLLSDKLLTKRDQLLLATQSALDAWLIAVIVKIDGHINELDFKSSNTQINDLRTMLESMQVKPNNANYLLSQVTDRFNDKAKQCLEQYKQPLANWNKNTYSLAHVATAFSAKDLPKEFYTCWTDISAEVYQTINERCAGIEKQFSKDEISVEEAVSALEEIASIVKDVPSESTDLYIRVKERYQKTVAQIQKDSVENQKDEVRHKNIQSLLAASEKLAKSLGEIDLETAYTYLSKTAKSLKESILASLDNGIIPAKELIYFANLYRTFSDKLDFLRSDRNLYASKLKEIVNQALADIKSGSSLYGSGTNQPEALKTIHAALTRLIEVQILSTATNEMAAWVDANLPNQVVELLLEVKKLLLANNEKFKTALATRNIADLDQSLVVAGAFQEVTLSIERYINACSLPSPLSEEFQTLKQLNNDFSYVGLRNMLLAELKSIRSELEALNPLELKAEGSAIRETFYSNLRRNIEFIQKMPELEKHVNKQLLNEKAVASDYGLEQCLKALASFLEKIFSLVQHQLKIVPRPSVDNKWVEFNRYYQELHLFVAQCSSGVACLSRLKLSKKTLLGEGVTDSSSPSNTLSILIDSFLSTEGTTATDTIEASLLAQFVKGMFIIYFRGIVTTFKRNFETSTSEAIDQELVALLAGLQKMAEDMPFLAEDIKTELKKFLKDIQAMRPQNYMSFLAVQLRTEEKGFGARMVAEQSVFAGMMTAERNTLTKQQDIDYVLNRMEVQDKKTGAIRSLSNTEYKQLREQYVQFDEVYNKLITLYISSQKNFAKFSQVHLGTLKAELLALINENKPDTDKNGHIIWNEKIAMLVPHLYAYLFTIWTLQESPAFFDTTNTDSNTNFLKKPHPAQMVAIFQMLNTIDAKNGLPNVLDELLTGQGKSVVLASTASLLALLGFAVNVGCYSEYLSGRDENAFKWLIDFLAVSEYIQYGTFNRLTEDMLNREGDLRDLLSNALFGTNIPIKPKAHHGRQTIALVDEVDSLVTAFFGHMYQPYFLLTGDHVNALLNAIWVRHENGTMNTFKDLQNLPEYHSCLKHYKGCEYIIKQAAREMFEDLQKYKSTQGHDFHVNSHGELYYKHFDGTTMSKSIGYRTYWACRDKANNVSKTCREKHEGIKITCGAYSYVDLMRNESTYRAMLGVTGTYRELSKAEKHVVKNVFGISGASFIPSAYGENKLQFNPGNQVIVVDDDEYNLRLFEQIAKNKLGWNNNGQPIRPVLVFFESEEELEAFYNDDAFKGYKSLGVNKMTSETITTTSERDTLISQATRAKAITLAIKEHGRGSDFMLTDPTVIANGGMAVIDGFIPETEAEQRQHQGRAGRQGQDGSFTMVIKKSELIKKFGLSEKEIEEARHAGNLYEVISAARNKKFSDGYQKLVDESGELFEKVHQPSMELLGTLHRSANSEKSSTKEIIDTHMKTLPGGKAAKAEVKLREAKVLILFDSTGSMGDLIEALKDTLAQVVETLGDVLREANCTFQLQLAHYEDYDSGPDTALCYTTEWSCDPIKLKQFISKVKANGGGNNHSECVELGLFHANQLANDGLNHVILIGDEPPSSENEMIELRKKHAPSNLKRGAFVEARHYLKEAEELAKKQIPVSTFFTRTPMFNSLKDNSGAYLTQKAFKQIADKTGGEAGELHLQEKATAISEVTNLFAKKIIGTVVQDSDDELADELFEKFKSRMQQYSR